MSFEDNKLADTDEAKPNSILKPSVSDLLRTAIAAATDPVLKATLEAELAKLLPQQTTAPTASSVEHARRADAALRDAETKHDQAVKSVVRLRGALAAAEAKEATAAQALVVATAARKEAVMHLAAAEGVGAEAAGGAGGPKLNLSWDEKLFDDLEGFEEGEKQAMMKLSKAEIKKWLEKAAEVKATVNERLRKKRRAEPAVEEEPSQAPVGGEDGRGDGPAQAADATPAAAEAPEAKRAREEREAATRAEAAKISQGKIAAETAK
ncbi:unnamed protein product, partial [Prorocentrum cordatum]